MLVLTRRKGEILQLFIEDELIAEIVIAKVGRDNDPDWCDRLPVRVGIQAPNHVKIVRSEITKHKQ